MHYIIGTRFSVITPRPTPGRPAPLPTRREKILPQGLSYQLIHISKVDNEMEYHFLGSDGNKHVVKFPSCKEADQFIAKQLNQELPNYYQQSQEDTV